MDIINWALIGVLEIGELEAGHFLLRDPEMVIDKEMLNENWSRN